MIGACNRNAFWRFGVCLPVFVGTVFALHCVALWWFSDHAFSGLFWIVEQTVVVIGITGLSAFCLLRLKPRFSHDRSETTLAHSSPEATVWSHVGPIGQIGFWYWRFDGDDVFWSEEAVKILGLDQAVITPSLHSFLLSVHPDDRDEIDRCFRKAYKMNSVSASEYRILRPDGSVRWIEARLVVRFRHLAPIAIGSTLTFGTLGFWRL